MNFQKKTKFKKKVSKTRELKSQLELLHSVPDHPEFASNANR